MIEFLRQRYYAQPQEVSIETLALCNAACVFCPYPTLERQGRQLPLSVIEGLIDQMSSWGEPFNVSPFKVNEPLLDARLQYICERIEDRVPQASLRIFTNGQPLIPKHIGWIADLAHVKHLWISLNSCDPQEYGDTMKLSFDLTARRLDFLHEAVANDSFPHPVVLSRVMSGGGAGADAKDEAFLKAIRHRWPWFKPQLIKRDGWLGYVEPGDPIVPQAPCGRWFEVSITAEGKAVLCCMDGKGEFVLGDVTKQPLLDIYNQPALQQRRLTAKTRAGIEPCARCSY